MKAENKMTVTVDGGIKINATMITDRRLYSQHRNFCRNLLPAAPTKVPIMLNARSATTTSRQSMHQHRLRSMLGKCVPINMVCRPQTK